VDPLANLHWEAIMRRVVLAGVFLALLALAPAAIAADGATPRLENLLPDHTFVFASVRDVPAARAQASRMALMKLWREPEVQEFLAPGLAMIGEQLAQFEAQTGHRLADLVKVLQGQVAMAVVEYDPMYGGLVPDAVILVDMGSAMPEFRKVHADALAGAGDEINVTPMEHAGVVYESIMLPVGLELTVAYLGNALTITTRPERMVGLIDAWQQGLPSCLAESATYRAVAKNTGGDATFANVFVNVESIMGYFGEQMDAMTGRMIEVLGVNRIKAVGMGSAFQAEGIRDSMFAYAPGEKAGLMGLMYTSPGDGTKLLSRVPASAFYASAGRVDLHEMMARIMELVGEVEPYVLDEMLDGLTELREQLGVDLQEDLLKPLGEEMALYAAMPDGGGLMPDLVFMNRLRNPGQFLTSLAKIVARAQEHMGDYDRLEVEIRSMQYMGKTIHYIHVGHRYGDPFPAMPALYLDGDLCVMALYPQVLKDHIARGPNAPSILTRPDFMRARRGLPENMDSLEYVDFQLAVRMLYGTLAPLAQLAANDLDCPVDMALLPRTETIARHFFGGAWGARMGAEGVSMHAYTPMGMMPIMMTSMLPALVMGRAMESSTAQVYVEPTRPMPTPVEPEPPAPALEDERPRAQLEEVYIALLFHFAQTDRFPSDLGELVSSRALENAGVLVLPGDKAPLTAGSGVKTSFVYLGPAAGNVDKDHEKVIWVHERDGRPGGTRWVLFASGDVRQVPEAEFKTLLEASRKMAK
jgi:uncharacterized protein DUF3352